jgi:hypothetical protein
MFHKLTDHFKPNFQSVCLSELDGLYREAISCLATDIRMAYCQRLVDRIKYDLENTTEKAKRKTLQQLLRVAEREICMLSAR